jgi:hypothetical protein
MDPIAKNIKVIKDKIQVAAVKSRRDAFGITVVAVTKTVGNSEAQRVYKMGIKDLGENRVQELRIKIDSLPQAKWHMIGQLQTNKVKDIIGKVSLIHSLDRWNLAEELNKRARMAGIEVPVLLQVNISGEKQKAGIKTGEVEDFLRSIGQLETVKICGLMTIAPLLDNPQEARPVFKRLYRLQQESIKKKYKNVDLKYLSMGMSQDFEIAVEEGANIVRIGSAIFDE